MDGSSIELDYQITLEDYLEGNKAITKYNFRKTWLSWIILRILPTFIVIFGLSCIVFGILVLNNLNNDYINSLLSQWVSVEQLYTVDGIVMFILGCIIAIFGIALPLVINSEFAFKLRSKTWEKSWQKNLTVAEFRKLKANEIGLHLESQTFKINCKWATITQLLESESVFILYLFTGEKKILPKRIFISETQINEFRELLDRNVKKDK